MNSPVSLNDILLDRDRNLLYGLIALRRKRGLEGEGAALERYVVGLGVNLHEALSVLQVAGVAKLQGRRADVGVVAGVTSA